MTTGIFRCLSLSGVMKSFTTGGKVDYIFDRAVFSYRGSLDSVLFQSVAIRLLASERKQPLLQLIPTIRDRPRMISVASTGESATGQILSAAQTPTTFSGSILSMLQISIYLLIESFQLNLKTIKCLSPEAESLSK